jgi:uncharacterized protein YqjF (DUF2071 family)
MIPLFRCSWEQVVMLHCEVEPDRLAPHVPLPVDLFHGRAFVSLVAITIRPAALPVPLSFFNLRTYAAGGIHFLTGWLPQRVLARLGPRLVGIPYRVGRLEFRHEPGRGVLRGTVRAPEGRLEYRAEIEPGAWLHPCAPGSIDAFLLERYDAHVLPRRTLRVRHRPWLAARVEARLLDDTLVRSTQSWFRGARLALAHYSPGFEEVGMGRLHERRNA